MTNIAPQSYIESINKTNKFKRYIAPWIPLLSLLVIFSVFWWLKLTGITLAGEAFCGMEEHAHTDSCYSAAEPCTKTEHIHTAMCYSDLSADLETQDTWEASVASAELTDLLTEDIVSIARTQLGYTESRYNFTLSDTGERLGYTRYGEWYGNPYGKWSSMFAAFVLNYAGLPSEAAPYNSGVETMRIEWEKADLTFTEGYTPAKGDLVFFDKDANGSADSVGIITSVSGGTLTVIEGDINDTVAETAYTKSDAAIMSYGSVVEAVRQYASAEDLARVENVIECFDDLPAYETVENTLIGYDETGNLEDYTEYWLEIQQQVNSAYVAYEALGLYRVLVTNKNLLEDLMFVRSSTFALPGSSIDIYQVNKYQTKGAGLAATTLVYGGTVGNKLSGNVLTDNLYWTAYVIEKSAAGFYVSEIKYSGESKTSLKAKTSAGFIVMTHDSFASWDAELGDLVEVDFDYTVNKSYNGSVRGTVTVVERDNSSALSTVESVSTEDFIKLNLYNYGNSINNKYESDSKFPGFQQSSGSSASTTAINYAGFNFGDNVTTEYSEGKSNITTASGVKGINRTIRGANAPISYDYLVNGNAKIMSDTLNSGGYPRLADGSSLKYLFSESNYADKANSDNIDGLFRYNETTGEYYYDSRINHAQFDDSSNEFVLYKQVITPNFIYYPFGNFLPFNDIVTQTTQTTKMDRRWFMRTALAAKTKSSSTSDMYGILASAMTGMNGAMDTKYSSSWNYLTAIKEYFSLSTPDLPGTDSEIKSHLTNIYNIDYDEKTDFFFGMDMELDFMQPKDGLTGIDGKQPMVYEFRGDDDVWVYIDGVLFLDLSGIHRHVGGKIDFVNGKVYYYELDVTTGDINTDEPFAVVTFEKILTDAGKSTDGLNSKGTFENYSEHTMKFFYMERGAGSSICSMSFNMPLLQNNSINVVKELEGEDASSLGDPDFSFQIWKENGTELLIGEGVTYSVMNQNGVIVRTGTTGANGIFTIKAGERAIFTCPENAGKYFVRELLNSAVFEQYDGVITVDGTAVTTDGYSNIKIDNEDFKGLDSPVKDISEGGTTFIFQNSVVANKYGSLTVKKTANEYGAAANKAFAFTLTLDGVPIPAGTGYTLISADGSETAATVATAGELILHAGETARFDKILAGTKIKIVESDASSQGYRVNYEALNLAPPVSDDTYAEGIITTNSSSVIISNDRNGTKQDFVGTKTLLYPDGGTHTFNIILAEINSPENPVYNGGVYLTQAVTLGGTAEAGFTFTLNFPPEDVGTSYYLIYEDNANAPPGGDKTKYILSVTTELRNGEVVITEKKLFKNGTETDAISFDFVNENLRTLTVSKTVEGAGTGPFEFEIGLTLNGTALSGEFETSDGRLVTFVDGKATLSLSGGETVTLRLPYGTAWTVTEKGADGYAVRSGTDASALTDSDSVGGELNTDAEAYFLNISAPELPSTGGYGQTPWILSGLALMLGSLVLAYISRRRTKGGNKQPS